MRNARRPIFADCNRRLFFFLHTHTHTHTHAPTHTHTHTQMHTHPRCCGRAHRNGRSKLHLSGCPGWWHQHYISLWLTQSCMYKVLSSARHIRRSTGLLSWYRWAGWRIYAESMGFILRLRKRQFQTTNGYPKYHLKKNKDLNPSKFFWFI